MTRPTKAEAKLRAIVDGLEAQLGVPKWQPNLQPLNELVACILSQHTSDINSGRAYGNLRTRYLTWEAVLAAPLDELIETIRSGGLANSKAARIQEVLARIKADFGAITLDSLLVKPDAEVKAYLLSLPGVGPKTAAIVLCFALGRSAIPVDTHVFRVSWRLGLVEKKIGEGKAHDALEKQVPAELVYRFHVALIEHGRRTCKAPTPLCGSCVVSKHCWYFSQNMPFKQEK